MPIRLTFLLTAFVTATTLPAIAQETTNPTQTAPMGGAQIDAGQQGLLATMAALGLIGPTAADPAAAIAPLASASAGQTAAAANLQPTDNIGNTSPDDQGDLAQTEGSISGLTVDGFATMGALGQKEIMPGADIWHWWVFVAETTGATGTGYPKWMGSGSF